MTWVTFPAGATTGQAGIVFGYKGVSDYYVRVIDLGAQQVRDYHVVDGVKTLLSTSGYGIAAGQKKVVRVDFTPTHGGWLPFTDFADGFPSGRVGLFSDVANVKYDALEVSAPPGASGGASSAALRLASSAEESSDTFNAIKPDEDRLRGGFHLVKGVRATRFRATFSETVDSGNEFFALLFDALDRHHYKEVRFGTTGGAPSVRVWDGGDGVTQTATTNAAAMPAATQGQTLWFRVESDGTTLTAKSLQSTTAPGDAAWSAASAGLTTSSVDLTGGQIGLKNISWWALLDDLTIQTDRTPGGNGSFETTEHVERFTADANGFVQDTLEYDAAGNLTYDGTFKYTYDAWNRQTKVTKAYRDDQGVLQLGSVVQQNQYDGTGRRIVVAVKNSGDLDHTEHVYYDGWSQVETRNGSGIVTKQMTWAGRVGGYIDELLQIAHNLDWPTSTVGSEDFKSCETKFWAMQDANYNVLGIVDDEGKLVERYEYTPYGERTVYTFAVDSAPSGWSHASTLGYRTVLSDGSISSYGANTYGHQGLSHDEVSTLIYNRARSTNPFLSRFSQRDPREYLDGMGLYEYVKTRPIDRVDPMGRQWVHVPPRNDGATTLEIITEIVDLDKGNLMAQLRFQGHKRGRDGRLDFTQNSVRWNLEIFGSEGYISSENGGVFNYKQCKAYEFKQYLASELKVQEDPGVETWVSIPAESHPRRLDHKNAGRAGVDQGADEWRPGVNRSWSGGVPTFRIQDFPGFQHHREVHAMQRIMHFTVEVYALKDKGDSDLLGSVSFDFRLTSLAKEASLDADSSTWDIKNSLKYSLLREEEAKKWEDFRRGFNRDRERRGLPLY